MNQQIKDWFATHEEGDGDFFISPSGSPFSVVPPTQQAATTIYSTKPHCLHRLVHDLGGRPSFAAIMRSGLPSDDDLAWLRLQVANRRLLFLGDADPADLLIFAWLRESLPIVYGGLSDSLLLKCKVDLQDELTIQLKESEVAALPLVAECLGDMSALLGQWCSEILVSRRKVELESLFSFANCRPSKLAHALIEGA